MQSLEKYFCTMHAIKRMLWKNSALEPLEFPVKSYGKNRNKQTVKFKIVFLDITSVDVS